MMKNQPKSLKTEQRKILRPQNTHIEVNTFATQKSKAQSRGWIVQKNLHVGETYTKGTCT